MVLTRTYDDRPDGMEWSTPWIGVGFDGVLATPTQDSSALGDAIPTMMDRVLQWSRDGKTVKIVTARAARPEQVAMIQNWLDAHGLPRLDVTTTGDNNMTALYNGQEFKANPTPTP